MRASTIFWLFLTVALATAACGGGDPGGGDGGTDTDTDADADGGDDGGGSGDCENPESFDEGTGIYWLACLGGQCWDGSACVWEGGAATPLTYAEAAVACPGGYRLPTIEEILGLLGNCMIDLAVNEPGACDACPASAACDAIYPGLDAYSYLAPEISHWSSTELATTTARVWWVNFQSGAVESKLKEMPGGTAVCVRSE
jgi:hypothetical protein